MHSSGLICITYTTIYPFLIFTSRTTIFNDLEYVLACGFIIRPRWRGSFILQRALLFVRVAFAVPFSDVLYLSFFSVVTVLVLIFKCPSHVFSQFNQSTLSRRCTIIQHYFRINVFLQETSNARYMSSGT